MFSRIRKLFRSKKKENKSAEKTAEPAKAKTTGKSGKSAAKAASEKNAKSAAPAVDKASKADGENGEAAEKPVKKRKKRRKRNPYVRIVAERTGRKYKETLAEMKSVREKYGISFKDYVTYKCENCVTEEDFNEVKNKKAARRNSTIIKLSEVTGWSEEEALREVERVEKKFRITAKKYYTNGMYLMSDEEIEERLKADKKSADRYMNELLEESGWKKGRLRRHMTYVQLKYGIDATDYRLLKAWRFKKKDLNSLSCLTTSRALTGKYNDHDEVWRIANKLSFDKDFSDCIQRKFWTNDEEADFESFCAFWDGLDEAMFKPLNLFQARGIKKISRPQDMKAAFDEYMDSPQFLLEEVIKQHSDIDAIYDGCVNTVRMFTLLKDDEFHVLCAFMKFGKDGCVVDNMVAGGMIAGVDEVNGIVETGGVDKDGNVHVIHPNSGKQIKGFKIPNYDKVLEVTEKALRKAQGLNYIGWDVAVCQDKAVIIEGNSLPGLTAYQLPYVQPPQFEPKLYKFEPYL